MRFYDDWAQRILHGQWTDQMAFYGLPLYAYLLAGVYKLFGYGPFVPGLLQAAFDAGTAVLIYKLGVRLFSVPLPEKPQTKDPQVQTSIWQTPGKLIGLGAALGWTFFSPAQAYATILMPTVWAVFAFWLVVWLVVRTDAAPSQTAALAYGFLVGFVATGVATVLFLVPLLLAAIFLKPWPTAKPDRFFFSRLAAAALLFIGIGAGTSPCWLHNYAAARDPVFLSAHGGVNFWIGNNPVATGYPNFPPGLHAGQEAMLKDSIKIAEAAAGHSIKRSEVSGYWSAKANDYIHHHPLESLRLLGRKIANFWNAFQYDDLSMITALREHQVILPALRFGLVAALAIPALLTAWNRFPLCRWIGAAVLLQMLSLLSVFVTERYRLAAVPGLLLFAACGIWMLWESCATTNRRQAAIYLALLALATWFVSVPKHDPSLWALDSYNSGWQALEANDLPTAEKKLKLAYSYVPENAEINFALGNVSLGQGNTSRAKSYYAATIRLDSTHEGAWNNLGVLALQENRWPLAAQFFQRALRQNPGDAKTHYLFAKALLGTGERQHATDEIARARELEPIQGEFKVFEDELAKGGLDSKTP